MSQPAAGTKTFYIFDGDSLLGEVQNTSGFPTTAAYTWGANGLVSERLISATPKSLWYHFGPQGETRLLTDSTGAVADTYTNYAYGSSRASSEPDINPFKYGGQYGYYNHPAAPTTGYLCGQRWYASGYGMFFTRDPIGYDGGDNLYGYCNDSPASEIDPYGESGEDHHPFPVKYGGNKKQVLVNMPVQDHRILHRELKAFARDYRASTGKNFVFSKFNKGEDITAKYSAREIEDFLGRFYRGPGAKYSAAACEFFKQVPAQSPKAIAATLAARRAYTAAQVLQAAAEARNVAMALDAAEAAAAVDEFLVIVGVIVK